MTLYLQRLLDRAAGLAAAPARAGLEPAIGSGSPILRFDQRLGDPALAADYAIMGASPPEPDLAEGGAPAAMPAPDQRRPGPTADPVPAAAIAAAAPPVPGEPAPDRQKIQPAAIAAPLDAAGRRPGQPPDPTDHALPQGQPSREDAQPAPAARAPAAEIGPDRPLRHEAAAEAEASIRRLLDPLRSETARPPSPPAPEAVEPAAVTPPAASPAVVPHTASESAAAAAPPDPVAAPSTPQAEPARRAAAAPRPEPIRPVAVEPPPLESPAPGPSAREIARLVEEAVRKALPGPESRPAGTAETDKAKPAPKPEAAARPATAAEASVIGKLERSSFSPMLFGVRRR
ncbi:hypothetical protein [Sphingosinicella terrae]|uniref:hypothetical protein n=1 Tax=Sphingosinicella terrae TaxID=2172047 RepID=UPI000E0D9EDC|nr:hypothetical protein [Sphingosinicella terrae]